MNFILSWNSETRMLLDIITPGAGIVVINITVVLLLFY